MFDRDALNNEWIEARQAWNEYEAVSHKREQEYAVSECDHPNAYRKQDGTRHKGRRCRECEAESFKAISTCNQLGSYWGRTWDLFETIGMSMKEENNGNKMFAM